MTFLKIVLFALLLGNSVLGRNTRMRGSTRHKVVEEEYKYNHPPEPENYETIPVAVVYDDESNREDKSIKSDISSNNNVEAVKEEPSYTKELSDKTQVNNKQVELTSEKEVLQDNHPSVLEDETKPTLDYNSNQELQIPVAVVYDSESLDYQKPRPSANRVQSKRRKVQRPLVEKKQVPAEPSPTEKNPSFNESENNYDLPEPAKNDNLNSNVESKPVQTFAKRDNSTRQREVIPIIQSENIVFSQSGNFQYSYEGGDGTKAFEKGELKTFDDDNTGEAVSGGFSYTAKDGNEYSLSYTADENGYRPVGAHLPTPPPIPPAIARALAYLATKTTPEPVTQSLYEYDYQ